MKKILLFIVVFFICANLFADEYNSYIKKSIFNQNGFYTIKWVDENNCDSYIVTLEKIFYINGKPTSSEPVYQKEVSELKIDISENELIPGTEYYVRVKGKKGSKIITVYEKDIVLESIINFEIPKTILYTYAGQKKTFEEELDITPGMFYFDSKTYNKYLASTSAVAAACAYYSDPKEIETPLINFYKELDFFDVEFYNGEAFVKSKEDADKVFYGIARRQVDVKRDTYDIISVVIRGTVAGEWFSNFNIGTDGYHAGFKVVADDVIKKIDEYIVKHNLANNKKTKIWITGHSRGGSVANILSYELLKKPYIKPENLYTYTFASTFVTRGKLEKSNCFNFVNTGDFVPVVPYWEGWKRFGTDITNQSLTKEDQSEIAKRFKDITGYNYEGYSEKQINDIIKELKRIAPTTEDFYNKKYNVSAKDGGKTAFEVCNILSNMSATGKTKDLMAIPNDFNNLALLLLLTDGKMPKVINAHSMEYYILFSDQYNSKIKDFSLDVDMVKFK